MAVLPPSSSSCLDLTISTPGFLSSSSSSSSSCKHLTPLPDSTTEEGSGVMKTTLNLFDMNQVPEDGDQEWLMVPATSMDRVDDDDQNSGDGSGAGGGGDGGGAPPRKKLRLSKEQSCLLEDTFRQSNTLSHKQKEVLAMQLKLKPRQVEVWFQNRRARSKLKQTEQECEYLKRWFGSLTEQNRRLRREVEQLRSLKVGPPTVFYPNSSSSSEPLPASTFTMCPRCERVSTSISASAADKGPTKSASAAASAAAAANLSLGPPSSNYHPRQHSAAC